MTVAYANVNRLSTANEWNTHTYVVRAEIKATVESLLNIESGQRGFSLIGVDASLEPLNAGTRAFKEHLDRTRELTADNPAQQERLRKLGQAQQRWMAGAIEPALAQMVGVFRLPGQDGAVAHVPAAAVSARGREMMLRRA